MRKIFLTRLIDFFEIFCNSYRKYFPVGLILFSEHLQKSFYDKHLLTEILNYRLMYLNKMNNNNLLGMYYGLALGDSLGAPHEYRYSKSQYTGKLEYNIERNSQFQGKKIGVIGEITDDTEMTIAIIDSLSNNNGQYITKDIIEIYCKFANSCSFLGNNIRALFYGIKTQNGYNKRYSKIYSFDDIKNKMQSNGCLMRASGLVFAKNMEEAIEIDVMLTNPNRICKDILTFYVKLLKYIVSLPSPNKQLVIEYINHELDTQEYIDDIKIIIQDIYSKKGRNIKGETKGWIIHAFWCSIYALIHFDSFTDGINFIIKLGGDTDTNGAITGSLLGGFYGLDQLNTEQSYNIEQVLNCDATKSNFKHYYHFQDGLKKIINLLY